jgi:hypothetical protein
MKIEQITEGKDSAALHVANAKRAVCLTKLEELLRYHKNIAAEEGTAVNGIDLADDLESFIESHRKQ